MVSIERKGRFHQSYLCSFETRLGLCHVVSPAFSAEIQRQLAEIHALEEAVRNVFPGQSFSFVIFPSVIFFFYVSDLPLVSAPSAALSLTAAAGHARHTAGC